MDKKVSIYEKLFRNSIGKLKDNVKTIDEMLKVLMGQYDLEPYEDIDFAREVMENTNNKYGEDDNFLLNNILTYKILFKDSFYLIGFNKNNNGIYVKNNEWLKRQLIILRGLNKEELSNIFLVGEYLFYKEGEYAYC